MAADSGSKMTGNALTESTLVVDRSPTVLVVEDEILVRMAVSEELRDHGYSVIEATNADEALVILHGPTRVDVVITDMKMPGAMDGAALVQWIRAKFPFVKVVMVSGQRPAPAVRSMLDGFLPKPVEPTHVATYVQTLTQAQATPEP